MTIFTTHDCRFSTIRRLLVAKEYMETTHFVYRLLLSNHSLKSSAIEVVADGRKIRASSML